MTNHFLKPGFSFDRHFFLEPKIVYAIYLTSPIFNSFLFYQGKPFKVPMYLGFSLMSYIGFCIFFIMLITFGDIIFNHSEIVEYYLIRITNFPYYNNLVPYKCYILYVTMASVFITFFLIVEVRLLRRQYRNKHSNE